MAGGVAVEVVPAGDLAVGFAPLRVELGDAGGLRCLELGLDLSGGLTKLSFQMRRQTAGRYRLEPAVDDPQAGTVARCLGDEQVSCVYPRAQGLPPPPKHQDRLQG